MPHDSRIAAHTQCGYAVRLDWGATGAAALLPADAVVVVDVLSFTTSVVVALERGITVLPFSWHDESAASYAAEHDAVLALGRFEAAGIAPGVAPTLSPASMSRVSGVDRVVLPSPNGSTICAAVADQGAEVVMSCLRNRSVVADLLAARLLAGGTVAVVAAGERWPDGSLRPCAEDLWGSGALLDALAARGVGGLSPEAELAVAAWRAVAPDPLTALRSCAGGRELAAGGFAADVDIASRVDTSTVVPTLRDGVFVANQGPTGP